MQDLSTTLASLRDLDGIVGSFVVNDDGDVVAKDLPAYFDGVLDEVGPRLLRLRDALDLAEGDVSSCNVRYSGYRLTIRSANGALIAVVADAKVNGPALRMAMNLVIRKCGPGELSRASFTPPPPSAAHVAFPITAAPPATATTTPNSADATRSETFEIGRPAASSAHRAPEGGSSSAPRKKRELLFRGKRLG